MTAGVIILGLVGLFGKCASIVGIVQGTKPSLVLCTVALCVFKWRTIADTARNLKVLQFV